MSRRLWSVLLLFFAVPAFGQAIAATGPGGLYTFGQITGTGQLGSALSFTSMPSAPSTHSIQYVVAGTAPSACSISLDGSLDGAHWFSLSGTLSCTSSGLTHIVTRPVPFVRANVTAYTKGDSTTSVLITYARGAQ